MSEPIVFQEFTTVTEADKILALLKEEGMSAYVDSGTSGALDDNFVGVRYGPMFRLMMKAEDFIQARQILSEKCVVDLKDVDSDYMLLSFTNNELQYVMAKPDEWGYYNYNVALALLKSRGVEISEHRKEELNEARLHQLSERKSVGKGMIFSGYGMSVVNLCLIMLVIYNELKFTRREVRLLFLPCVIGVLIGRYIKQTKKTLPDGTSVLTYKDSERKHGSYIIVLNLIAVIICTILYVTYSQ